MEQISSGIRALSAHLQGPVLQRASPPSVAGPEARGAATFLEVRVPLEFHRRMAAIIAAVQTGVWGRGVHEVLGYATDFGLGQSRGVQTLVLKTRGRSAYIRLAWDTVMSDAADDLRNVADHVDAAIRELS